MERAEWATEPVIVEYRVLPEGGDPRWVVSRGRAPSPRPENRIA